VDAAKLLLKALNGSEYAAARCARRLDDRNPEMLALLPHIFNGRNGAQLIGLTGNPGAGKSTLTNRIVRAYRAMGHRVAVVAVDPSSPFTGGAILGDRVRMQEHAGDTGVFIRSVATRGVLGGISHSTRDLVALFDYLGYDRIIIETVGVGQDEIDIAFTVETNIVVCLPGTGDGVQMIKAGLLETADIFVLNKADHPDANRAVSQLEKLVSWSQMKADETAWSVPVCQTIAIEGTGVDALISQVDAHHAYREAVTDSEARADLRRRRWTEEIVLSELQARARAALSQAVVDQSANPYELAQRVLREVLGSSD
jgi:LAO/AO transport system kinase